MRKLPGICTVNPWVRRALLAGALALAVTGYCASTAATASRAGSGASATATVARPALPGRIAFRRYLNDAQTISAIFTSAPDGSDEVQITSPSASTLDDEPDWASDGKRLLFTRITAEGSDHEAHQLFSAAADGSGVTPVSPGALAQGDLIVGFDGSGAFSPDGKQIAATYCHGKVVSDQIQFCDIVVMNADGSRRRRVTHSPAYAGDLGGSAWSPDGKRLVYARSSKAGRALFLIGIDGRNGRRLTPLNLGAGGTPDWSRAGNRIVFRAVANEEQGIGNFFTIKPDGTSLTKITRFSRTVISHKVGFSPDGQWIVYAKSAPGGNNNVFTSKLNGSDLQQVTNTPQASSSPDWGRSG